MPAHTGRHSVNSATCSDGSLLTALSRRANALADLAAKHAAHSHRVPWRIRSAISQQIAAITHGVAMVGCATAAANAHEVRIVDEATGEVYTKLARDSMANQDLRDARLIKHTAPRESGPRFLPRAVVFPVHAGYESAHNVGRGRPCNKAAWGFRRTTGAAQGARRKKQRARERQRLASLRAAERETIAAIRRNAGAPKARAAEGVTLEAWMRTKKRRVLQEQVESVAFEEDQCKSCPNVVCSTAPGAGRILAMLPVATGSMRRRPSKACPGSSSQKKTEDAIKSLLKSDNSSHA